MNQKQHENAVNIEGLKLCKCIDMDSLPNRVFLTDVNGVSVNVLICPICSGQIETEEQEE